MKAIIREKILALRRQSPGGLFTLKELVRKLKVEFAERRTLLAVLQEMEDAGVVFQLKRSKYGFAPVSRTVVGRLELHVRGFGFVRPEAGGGDIYIGPHLMGYATHGDRVVVEISRGRSERSGKPRKPPIRQRGKTAHRAAAAQPESTRGRVVQVLERANQRIIGRVCLDRDEVTLQPLDDRLPFAVVLRGQEARQLSEGAIVEAEILVHPGRHTPALGKLNKVIGLPGDKDLALKITLCKYGIPAQFPEAALQEAARLQPQVSPQEISGRRDFRPWPTVTIDGQTARDFDDAITLEDLDGGGFLLGVHIADVARYVPEGGALDREAFQRGNSVYFPDRAVPMLPPQLSSGICSLNPGVDRLVFSVLMRLSAAGEVLESEFARGVINSDERMTYTSVAGILLRKDPAERERYGRLIPLFERMQRLCLVLQLKRRARGAIDLDLPEAEVRLDAAGEVLQVVKSERNLAHQIIEEFMLLANETVAGQLEKRGLPALYRIHETPDPAKVREFAEVARLFGFSLRNKEGVASPGDFQRLSDQLRESPQGGFLSYLMLRTFALARYSENNGGHFGLASPCYTHFTSPIRRYADLVVHRLLAAASERPPGELAATEGLDPQQQLRGLEQLQQVAAQTSRMERIAAEAEREVTDYYRARLLARHLGEEFDGCIGNVIASGFFVQLDEPFVEGFVPAAFLDDDDYVYRQEMRALVARGGKRMFRLGDRIRIQVDNVDLDTRRLLFSPV